MEAWTQRRGDRRALSWLWDFDGGMQPVLRDHKEVAGNKHMDLPLSLPSTLLQKLPTEWIPQEAKGQQNLLMQSL